MMNNLNYEIRNSINTHIVNLLTGVNMTKQYFTRDEVKTLLREAIQCKHSEAEEKLVMETETKPEKTYTFEEVKALIIKDREARKAS